MAKVNWKETLKWEQEQLDDLRFAGYSYLRQGKYDIAFTFFEALTILDPNNSYDNQTLGALYLQLGNPIKAMQYLDKALELEPNHVHTLLNLSKTMFLLGRKEEGLKLAKTLSKHKEPSVANIAKALLLAYS
jgi:tetratricopeptide (TPR) repeat protein